LEKEAYKSINIRVQTKYKDEAKSSHSYSTLPQNNKKNKTKRNKKTKNIGEYNKK
jgi:hypothetical protein